MVPLMLVTVYNLVEWCTRRLAAMMKIEDSQKYDKRWLCFQQQFGLECYCGATLRSTKMYKVYIQVI